MIQEQRRFPDLGEAVGGPLFRADPVVDEEQACRGHISS